MQRMNSHDTNRLRATATRNPSTLSSRTVRAGAGSVERYIHDIYDISLLDKSQEVELATRMRVAKDAGDTEAYEMARDDFVSSNLRLVISIAKKFANCGVPLSDLVQEGNIGLLHAVEKFDPTLDIKFSTYATWWIKQAVIRGIYTQSRTIRIPINLSEAIYRRGREEAMGVAPGEATAPQRPKAKARKKTSTGSKSRPRKRHSLLSDERREDFRQVTNLSRPGLSMDAPLTEDGGTFGDLMADDRSNAATDELDRNMLHESLDGLLGMLEPLEESVIRLRYGLEDEQTRTLEEVAKICGYSRERIRQIEAKAFRKLRTSSHGRALRAML